MVSNKKGWLKIVEAFTAILLIMVVLIIVVNRGYVEKSNISKSIYETEVEILKGIVLNHRDWISGRNIAAINDEVVKRTPNYLMCEANICDLGDLECETTENDLSDIEDVYVQTALILDDDGNDDKQLKIFCWVTG